MNFQESQEELLHSLLSKSYEVESDLSLSAPTENLLIDEEDRLILMHRDAHFGGSFAVMLEYYWDEKKGAVLDVSPRRIEALKQQEDAFGKNIAPFLLNGADAEKVQASKKMYQSLASLFDSAANLDVVREIANLILSEEEDYEKECRAIISLGQTAVPYLIEILESPIFKDPLFPGYGTAPACAAFALGELKAEAAIEPLFQLLREDSLEYEEVATQALHKIGEKAKIFLIRLAGQKPITRVNECAVLALLPFKEDETVSTFFLELLKDKELQKITPFACYLALGCEELPQNKRREFNEIAKTPQISKILLEEIELISNYWEKK